VSALLSAFPNRSALAQIVRMDLSKDLDAIAAPGTSATVFDVVSHAEAQGLVPAALDAALATAPGNPEILALAAEAKAKIEEETKARIEADAKAKGHPGEATAGWRRAVAQIQDFAIGVLAAKRGVPPMKYRALVNAHLKKLFGGFFRRALLFKRVELAHLDAILSGGRFKSQFETGKSGGALSFFHRNQIEGRVFGFDGATTPVQQRPQYGYLSMDPNGAHPSVSQYGDTTVRFKTALRDRTTFTFGDSGDTTAWGMRPSVTPKPVNAPEFGAFDFGDPHAPNDPLAVKSLDDFRPYVEWQAHGGLDVNSIAEVIFDHTPPTKVVDQLNDLHIPWRVK